MVWIISWQLVAEPFVVVLFVAQNEFYFALMGALTVELFFSFNLDCLLMLYQLVSCHFVAKYDWNLSPYSSERNLSPQVLSESSSPCRLASLESQSTPAVFGFCHNHVQLMQGRVLLQFHARKYARNVSYRSNNAETLAWTKLRQKIN